MKRFALVLSLLIPTTSHAADWTKLRRISQLAGCAASMIDARSTIRPGLTETNPLLGRGQPNSGRIVGLKLGICAGSIALAEWSHHKAPQDAGREKVGAYVGIASAGVYSGLAVQNYRIRVGQ